MIAEQNRHVRHVHKLEQNVDAVRMPINHVPDYIQLILRLKLNLIHDRIEPPAVAVYITHYINHSYFIRWSSVNNRDDLSFCLFLQLYRSLRSPNRLCDYCFGVVAVFQIHSVQHC